MDKVFGQSKHALDTKGRVFLPVKFRPRFAEGGFLAKHRGGCLALWTPATFDQHVAAVEAEQDQSAAKLNLARVFSAGTEEVEIDRQGRLTVPPYLRTFAQLSDEVLVNGAINRVELWNPQVWQEKMAAAEEQLMDNQ
ncbi:MAG: division/cell wall cluster transcriptional repressor MraZ [Acidimicrobiales bacterium]